METLISNLLGKARRETLLGVEYLVVPATLIVPGVLNGSEGPLYYPPEEVSRHPEVWNHKPVTLNHPPRPAYHTDILNQYQLGILLNTRYEEDRLRAELWLNLYRVMNLDSRILTSLNTEKAIEVSTGLIVDKEVIENEREHNGKKYRTIAKNYRPDHLAILMDSVGACSVKDGCGVLNELKDLIVKRTPEEVRELITLLNSSLTGEPTMAKKELVDQLLTLNCGCWENNEADRTLLTSLSDEKVTKLIENAKKPTPAPAPTPTPTPAPTPTPSPSPTPTPTPTPAPTPAPSPSRLTKADVMNCLKEMSPTEWFEMAPPEVQDQAREYNRVTNEEKAKLIGLLVENVSEAEREATSAYWKAQPIETLRMAAKGIPAKNSGNNPYASTPVPNYSGQAGGVYNSEAITPPTPLGLPRWDFELAKKN